MKFVSTISGLLFSLAATDALAGGMQTRDDPTSIVLVQAERYDLFGIADSATQGTVTGKQLENRPRSRTAEMLEAVPGFIVTQHSGDGKANQYYVRGFNLDHGTDFRTTVLGMPVNMPSHAHGQGYADMNFVIPELVHTIKYKKGTYYAEEGDFSAAGAAAFDYVRSLPEGLVSAEAGAHDYRRMVAANSSELGAGTLLYAGEQMRNDGPWTLPERYRRVNGVLSYSWKNGSDDVRLAAMAMQSSWQATDQVPLRAIADGTIGRFGTIDASDGGETSRASLSAEWKRRVDDGSIGASAYLVRSRLDLFSNFTYYLDDPVNGDQFEQAERRTVTGAHVERMWAHEMAGRESQTTLGAEWRHDRLSPVGLYATAQRVRLATRREDRVAEDAVSAYASNATAWTPLVRTVAGLRVDRYRFDVRGDDPAHSGEASSTIASPKLSVIFTPSKRTELYLNWGKGFHSNDARSVVGQDADNASPLVKATGKEAGLRVSGIVPHLQTSLSLWRLDIASELVFVGDAGSTEAASPSRRTGVEIANYYTPAPGWIVDADVAWSRARFTGNPAAGSFIPGAIERTASLGISAEDGPWSGGLRLRYFGGRPLNEDNSVRSPSSMLINARFGYKVTERVRLGAEVLNLFDRKAGDVDYFYASRLRGEAQPVDDTHTHPAEPRTLRVALTVRF